MNDDNDQIIQIKRCFKKTHGIEMNIEDTKTALENLTDFFSLLYQFDLADRQKSIQDKGQTYA